MPLFISSKRKTIRNIQNEISDAIIIDVTSKASDKYIMFSPFYPHGNIPVPYSENTVAYTVEGIWQGLKVFQNQGVDISKFNITDMKNIKRTVRKYGNVLGHQKGINSTELIDYYDARLNIYIPSYEHILKNYLIPLIDEIANLAHTKNVILLDYETNANIEDLTKPLSHASLIKQFIDNNHDKKY